MRIFWIALIALTVTAACRKPKIDKEILDDDAPDPITTGKKECFLYRNASSEVRMMIVRNSTNVSGELDFDNQDGTGSSGTISGTFVGDTLYVDYTYRSLGDSFLREAIFIRKGNSLIEGEGEMEIRDEKKVYKNPRQLDFSKGMILNLTDCQ